MKSAAPAPAAGQVWADCDPRTGDRHVRLLVLKPDGRWQCESVIPDKGGFVMSQHRHPTRIHPRQFRHPQGSPARSGFRFVAESM